MMEVDRLHKTFGAVAAAAGVTFEAPDGLVTGLLGPNGAGKTTTIRALSGLLTPDTGAARVDGRTVAADPAAARRRLGLLPESVGLYDRLTAREHLRYAGHLHGLGGRDLDGRITRLLSQFRLEDCADRRAGTLSFGQRRRVALARALVHDPANVILDEPTNGLDVMSARQVRDGIRRLAIAGRAVILASHVMPDVAAVCDRVVVLARGRVLASGSPASLVARTGATTLEEAFVALIGSDEGLQ